MSARLSNLNLIGNIGAAPEFKHKEGETPFCVFTMAVDRPPRKRGEERDPLWYRVTLWGHQAENAVKSGYKGQQVYVAGRLDVSDWTDRDGRARYTLEVAGSEFQMLGESITALAERTDAAIAADRGSRGGTGGKGAAKSAQAKPAAGDDDLSKEY